MQSDNPYDNPNYNKPQYNEPDMTGDKPPLAQNSSDPGDDGDVVTATIAGLTVEPQRKSRGCLWMVLTGLVLFGGFTVGAVVLIWKMVALFTPHEPQPEIIETYEKKYEYVSDTFAGNKTIDQDKRELAEKFIRHVGSLAKQQDEIEPRIELDDATDYQRMLTQVVRLRPGSDLHGRNIETSYFEDYVTPITNWPVANLLDFVEFKLYAVREIGDGSEWLIYFKILTPDDDWRKLRMWVTVRKDKLKIFDIEDLRNTQRLSKIVGTDFHSDSDYWNFDEWLKYDANRTKFLDAMTTIDNRDENDPTDDIEKADKLLSLVKVDQLDQPEQLRFYLYRLLTHWLKRDFDAMLDEEGHLLAYSVEAPIALIYEGIAKLGKEKYQAALLSFNEYEQLMGPDYIAQYWIGQCQTGLGETDKAIDAYTKCLDMNRCHVPALVELGKLKLETDPEMIEKRFARVANHPKAFDQMSLALNTREQFGLIKKLVEIYRPIENKDFLFDWYDSIFLHREEKYKQAADKLQIWLDDRESIEKIDPFRIVSSYVKSAVHAYTLEQIYLRSHEHIDCITALGHEFDGNGDRLLELADFCEAKKIEASYPLYYRASGLIANGKHADAYTLLQSKLDAIDTYHDKTDYLEMLYQAGAASGQAVKTYQDAERKKMAFETILPYLLNREKSDELRQLVEAAKEHIADDENVIYAGAVLLSFDKKYEETYQALKPILCSKPVNERHRRLTVMYAFSAQKAGKLDEAYQAAHDKLTFFDFLAYRSIEEADIEAMAKIAEHYGNTFQKDDKYLYCSATIACMKKDWQTAKTHWLAYREHYQDIADIDYLIAYYAHQADEMDACLDTFEFSEPVAGYFSYLLTTDRNAKALRTLTQKWKEKYPDRELSQFWKLALLLFDNQHAEALTILKDIKEGESAQQYVDRARFWAFMVECYMTLDQKDQAIAAAEEAAALVDDRFKLATALYYGDRETAKPALAKMIDEQNFDQTIVKEDMTIKFVMQKPEAKQMLDELLKADDTDGED